MFKIQNWEESGQLLLHKTNCLTEGIQSHQPTVKVQTVRQCVFGGGGSVNEAELPC